MFCAWTHFTCFSTKINVGFAIVIWQYMVYLHSTYILMGGIFLSLSFCLVSNKKTAFKTMHAEFETDRCSLKGSEIMMLRCIVMLVSAMFSIIRPGIMWLIKRTPYELPRGRSDRKLIQEQGEPNDHIDPERPDHVVINVEQLIHAQHDQSVQSSPVLTVEGIPNISPLGSIPEQDQIGLNLRSGATYRTLEVSTTVEEAQARETTLEAASTSTSLGLQQGAYWVTTISASGVITVLAGFLGNHSSKQTHHFLFKASMGCMLVSFSLGLAAFLLSTICSQSSLLGLLVKILGLLIMLSVALVVGFGAAFFFQKCC